jgi:hypothetical protein
MSGPNPLVENARMVPFEVLEKLGLSPAENPDFSGFPVRWGKSLSRPHPRLYVIELI